MNLIKKEKWPHKCTRTKVINGFFRRKIGIVFTGFRSTSRGFYVNYIYLGADRKSKRLIFISRDRASPESNSRKYFRYSKYGGFITVISRKHDSRRY